jgi:hypothetical protein
MQNRIISHEEWGKARLELLAAEKEFTRQRDASRPSRDWKREWLIRSPGLPAGAKRTLQPYPVMSFCQRPSLLRVVVCCVAAEVRSLARKGPNGSREPRRLVRLVMSWFREWT